MVIRENRRSMYQRLDGNKRWTNEFREGAFEFVQFVTSQGMFQMQDEQTRCPCKKCKCKVFKFVDDVMRDLYEEEEEKRKKIKLRVAQNEWMIYYKSIYTTIS